MHSVEDTSRTFFCDIIIYDVILIVYKHQLNIVQSLQNLILLCCSRISIASFPGLGFVEGSSSTVGAMNRMSKVDNKGVKPLERPVITQEVYSGEQPWEDWIDQFESIAAINGWDK